MRVPDECRRLGEQDSDAVLPVFTGGLHCALSRSNVEGTVVRAFDWDQAACRVYAANHGLGVVRKVAALSRPLPPVVAHQHDPPYFLLYRSTLHHSPQPISRSSKLRCGSCRRRVSRTRCSTRWRRVQKIRERSRSSASWKTCSRSLWRWASTRATCSSRTSPDSRYACPPYARVPYAVCGAPGPSRAAF